MIRCLPYSLLLFALAVSTTSAQFPQALQLSSTSPAIVRSSATRVGYQYTITVTGTYSMWPPYDSYGVDAAYVYDVPQSEVQAFRWPPAFMYPIPHWVGDTLEVPSFTYPGQQFKFRTRDNIGFRFNAQPLPDRGLSASHRYRTTIVGDGRPIEFQILDSAFSLREGKIIPRYEDNSGSLNILVEERPYYNLCSVETYCENGSMRLAIAASLLEYDSTGRPQNSLRRASQITVVVDGRTIEADSISCSTRAPVAYTLVLDRSGSMKFPYDGATDRMTALKRAAHGFLRTMKPGDQAMLITFSYDDEITIDVPWTSDTSRLGRGIDAIDPVGGTAWRDAAWIGLDQASRHYNPLKAVVLLTDGDDTHSQRTLESVVAKARAVNVPVFAIGMALVDSSERPLRYLAAQSNGRFFQSRDQRAIDSAFSTLSRAIESDECCTVHVTLPREVTAVAGVKRFDIYARGDSADVALRSHMLYVSDSCSRPLSVPDRGAHAASISVVPNPMQGAGRLRVDIAHGGIVDIELVAGDGRVRRLVEARAMDAGRHDMPLETGDQPSGVYGLIVRVDEREAARLRLVIVR